MARDITWGDDIIDSRDIIARIDELESERSAWIDDKYPDAESYTEDLQAEWAAEYPDEADELRLWTKVQDEAEGYAADWHYGESLILDAYFVEYAQDLAEDIGAVPKDLTWPASYIDWDAAADALRGDYTSIEVDGLTYWTR